ncbi:MAG: hypothetical protein ACUVUP_05555 [Thermaceae bacterium]
MKRMFQAVGNRVLHLERLVLGPLRLDLPLGQVRPLRAEEEQAL